MPIVAAITSSVVYGDALATAIEAGSCDGGARRTPFVSGSAQTLSPARTAKGAANAMPAPKVDRDATPAMTTGARNCTPRDTFQADGAGDHRVVHDGGRPDDVDPAVTFAMRLTADPEQALFEYACHEGNYAMRNLPSAARAAVRAAGASAK